MERWCSANGRGGRHGVHHVLRVVIIYYPEDVAPSGLRGGWCMQGGKDCRRYPQQQESFR